MTRLPSSGFTYLLASGHYVPTLVPSAFGSSFFLSLRPPARGNRGKEEGNVGTRRQTEETERPEGAVRKGPRSVTDGPRAAVSHGPSHLRYCLPHSLRVP